MVSFSHSKLYTYWPVRIMSLVYLSDCFVYEQMVFGASGVVPNIFLNCTHTLIHVVIKLDVSQDFQHCEQGLLVSSWTVLFFYEHL